MPDGERQRFRLGLFVVGATVLLAVLTVFFGGTPRVFTARDRYTLLLVDAPGVTEGTPVRRSGVRIGEVTAVELDNDTGEVRVEIAISRKFSLRTTDEAVVNQDLLSRDTTIDFVPRVANGGSQPNSATPSAPVQPTPKLKPPVPTGPPVPVDPPQGKGDKGVTQATWLEQDGNAVAVGQPPLGKDPPPRVEIQNPPVLEPMAGDIVPPGATIRGRSPTDPRTILSQATDVIPTVQQSLNQIRRMIEVITPRLDETTREIALLARSLRETVPEVRRTNDEVRLLLQGFRNFGPLLRKTNDELQTTITNFGRVAERVDVLIQTNQSGIEASIRSINELAQRANLLLSEENQRNATATLNNLQKASAKFEGVVTNADEFLKEGRKTAEQFQQSLKQADATLANVAQATKPFAERSDRVLRNLDVALEQFAKVAMRFGDLVAPLGRGDGTVQKFFSDPGIYNNLNDATLMLTRILPRLDRVLKDVEVFADKIARHPETIGVGGAVRPSGGLKEGPTGIAQPAHRQRSP